MREITYLTFLIHQKGINCFCFLVKMSHFNLPFYFQSLLITGKYHSYYPFLYCSFQSGDLKWYHRGKHKVWQCNKVKSSSINYILKFVISFNPEHKMRFHELPNDDTSPCKFTVSANRRFAFPHWLSQE